MFSLYFILKFIHVTGIIFWVGSVTTLTIMIRRAIGRDQSAGVAALADMALFLGQRVIGPASGIALLAGIALVVQAKIGFMTLWVLWGFTGFALHILLGVTVLRKNGTELQRLAASPGSDRAALAAALNRQKTISTLYVLIMLSVVWAMVAKPTL